MPLDAGKSLSRVFANWSKGRASRQEEAERKRAEEWTGYVENSAKEGRIYEKGLGVLGELNYTRWPDLVERVEKAKSLAVKKHEKIVLVREQERAKWDAERAANKADSKEVADPKKRLLDIQDAFYPKLFRHRGKAVVNLGRGKGFRIDEDMPSMWGSHLLGHEGEWGSYVYYREATPEEEAELEAKEQAERDRQERMKRTVAEVAAIRQRIKKEGEQPEKWSVAEGDRLLNTGTIYGGGDWFVVGEEWIWYVQNNGGDGDDWRPNNVRTGGAGAIGWRIPFDPEVAEALRRLETEEGWKHWTR